MNDLTNPHATPAADCIVRLAATPDGLTAPEAARRLADHGPNRLPEVRVRGPVVRFLRQFHNVLIYVLIGAAVVTGALQHWVDTGVILAVILANAVIGFIQEGKAEAAMAATGGCLRRRLPCCAMGGGFPWMAPTLCPATSFFWRPATRCPPTCG